MSNKIDQHHIEEIDCLEAIDNLYAYLDGELDDEETLARFRQHLSHCRSCYSRSEMEGVINERLRISSKGRTPASLKRRLREFMDDL